MLNIYIIIAFIKDLPFTLVDVFAVFFDSCYGILKSFYVSFLGVLSDEWFPTLGQDFFNFIFVQSYKFSFSYNIVYYVVGLFLFVFVLKHLLLPLLSALVQALLDLFTPL